MAKQLWAPWRLEYIKQADEQQGCIFCLAASGSDEDGLVVHRGDRGFVLLNKFPYSSGHLMVAPYRHVGEFGELEADEAAEIHRLAAQGLGALAAVYSRRATTWAGTWAASPAPGSSTTCTNMSSLAGPGTRTSCRCWPT